MRPRQEKFLTRAAIASPLAGMIDSLFYPEKFAGEFGTILGLIAVPEMVLCYLPEITQLDNRVA